MQLTILRQKTYVASQLFFYVELWAENTNPQHRHTAFAISRIEFSETLYKTKLLHESWDLWAGPILAVLSLLLQKFSWSSSSWDIYCGIYRP